MADFIFERDGTVMICLRVPRGLWNGWEYRHQHYGKAIHTLRESVIEIMSSRHLEHYAEDQGDPFFAVEPRGT